MVSQSKEDNGSKVEQGIPGSEKSASLTELHIRLAVPDDLPVVKEIYTEAAHWILSKGIHQWHPDHWDDASYAGRIAAGELFLGMKGDTPAAMFILYFAQEEFDRRIWGEDLEPAGYVHRLTVRRAYGGQGIGARLLRFAEHLTAARGVSRFRLDCMANNGKLNEFYSGEGYTYKGRYESGKWQANRYERLLTLEGEPDSKNVSYS